MTVAPRRREPGEREDVGHVRRRRREADDVAAAARRRRSAPGPRRSPGTWRAPRRGSRPGRPPSSPARPARIAASAAAWTAACWRTSSEARWNPNVADLPAAVRDLAPGDPVEPVGDERLLDLGQLRVELLGPRVAAGQRSRLAGQRGPRPAQPLGDEPEALAVRLVGEAAAELAVGLGQVLGVAGEARRERAARPARPATAAATVCIRRVATAS